ncbi:uncharacterized protein LOC116610744 [Nematostella vectensis]|uniref:uncharacterized protein LOC116610744 n=1 Tax=Nematostella vectensis TaxID=45351 RepID=UPI0020773754|nr:uncharacterized protein LOC116610744 [Nematostella vectensis]XP_032227427.2 uncharacterized protein LOC116610744 [Nematostella vectensis]
MNYSYYSQLLDSYRRRMEPNVSLLSIRRAVCHSYQNEAAKYHERCRQERAKQRRTQIQTEREISTIIKELKKKEREIGQRYAHIKKRHASSISKKRTLDEDRPKAITVFVPSMNISKAGATGQNDKPTQPVEKSSNIQTETEVDQETYRNRSQKEKKRQTQIDVFQIPKITPSIWASREESDLGVKAAQAYEQRLRERLGIACEETKHVNDEAILILEQAHQTYEDQTCKLPAISVSEGETRMNYIEQRYFKTDKQEMMPEDGTTQYKDDTDSYVGPGYHRSDTYELLIVDHNAQRSEVKKVRQRTRENDQSYDILTITEKPKVKKQ